ncbi:MAG: hypothetical protein KQH63_21490 [Desulfobulbaceae bacterium]|nr:hypothetical protein [Desulfobulbaceae bacterium]
MEITNSGGAALFALQQALQQPQNLVDQLTKPEGGGSQSLQAASSNAQSQQSAAVLGGKGSIINIVA